MSTFGPPRPTAAFAAFPSQDLSAFDPPKPMANGGTMVSQSRSGGRGGWLQMALAKNRFSSGSPQQDRSSVIGGGGGGGGRPSQVKWEMAPQDPDKRIGQRVGPRTTSEWVKKNEAQGGRGLTPNYGSNLDDFYRMNPRDADAKAAAQNNFENYGKMGPMDPAKLEQAQTFAKDMGWGFDPAKGYKADGGTMDMSVGKPTIVGEEGPELILPRDDGRGFVLPTDITRKILPVMRDVTPRQEGGNLPMGEVFRTPGGFSSAFISEAGSGSAIRLPAGSVPLASQDNAPFMIDPQTDVQLQMGQPGLPAVPDVVQGDFANPAGLPMSPEQQQQLTDMTMSRAMNLAARPGVMTDQQRFDAQMVPDQRVSVSGRDRLLTARGSLEAPQMLPLSEMRNRVMERSNLAFQASEDARVQRDLAARAARPSMLAGTPIGAIPGINPAVQARMDRSLERFYRTPQGAAFLAEQQAQQQLNAQRSQLASTAIPVTDPATGQVMGWTNGLGASLPNSTEQGNKRVHATREVNGQMMKIFTDGSMEPLVPEGTATVQPVLAWDGSKVVTLPAGTDVTALPGLTPLPRAGADMGGPNGDANAPTEQQNSGRRSGHTPGRPKPNAMPVQVQTPEQARSLPKGTRFVTPDGKVKIR